VDEGFLTSGTVVLVGYKTSVQEADLEKRLRIHPEPAFLDHIRCVAMGHGSLQRPSWGVIALNDDTMHDLVPGGSVVVIDKSLNKVEMGEWKTINERPTYFVWHEKGLQLRLVPSRT